MLLSKTDIRKIGEHLKKFRPVGQCDFCGYPKLEICHEVRGIPGVENNGKKISVSLENPAKVIQLYCPECRKVALFLADGIISK